MSLHPIHTTGHKCPAAAFFGKPKRKKPGKGTTGHQPVQGKTDRRPGTASKTNGTTKKNIMVRNRPSSTGGKEKANGQKGTGTHASRS